MSRTERVDEKWQNPRSGETRVSRAGISGPVTVAFKLLLRPQRFLHLSHRPRDVAGNWALRVCVIDTTTRTTFFYSMTFI